MDCVLSSRISKSDRVTQDKGGIRFRLRLLFLNGLTRSTERSVGRFFSLSTFGLLRSQKGRRGALEKQKWDPTETEFFGLIKFPRVRYRTLLRDIKGRCFDYEIIYGPGEGIDGSWRGRKSHTTVNVDMSMSTLRNIPLTLSV